MTVITGRRDLGTKTGNRHGLFFGAVSNVNSWVVGYWGVILHYFWLTFIIIFVKHQDCHSVTWLVTWLSHLLSREHFNCQFWCKVQICISIVNTSVRADGIIRTGCIGTLGLVWRRYPRELWLEAFHIAGTPFKWSGRQMYEDRLKCYRGSEGTSDSPLGEPLTSLSRRYGRTQNKT